MCWCGLCSGSGGGGRGYVPGLFCPLQLSGGAWYEGMRVPCGVCVRGVCSQCERG